MKTYIRKHVYQEVKNMATTVNNAFAEFMKEKVNLDQEKTKTTNFKLTSNCRFKIFKI